MTQRSPPSPTRWNLLCGNRGPLGNTNASNQQRRFSKEDSTCDSSTSSTKSASTCASLDSILSKQTPRTAIRQRLSDRRKRKSKKEYQKVRFGAVEIREYAVILGDNPTIIGGFPLSLDWKFNIKQVQTIEQHQWRATIFDEPPRAKSLTSDQRKTKLQTMGFSKEEIWAQERRRKVIVASEWAYGTNDKLPSFSPTAIVNKYVV